MRIRVGAGLVIVVVAAACATAETAPPPSTTSTSAASTTTMPLPASSTSVPAPSTTSTTLPSMAVSEVVGEGPACSNTTAIDNTARPVFTFDCPVTAAAWRDADYRVKGRTGVLGWLHEDDPDGLCGIPGAYYQCYDAPMRATLGGVLLEIGQASVVTPVWSVAADGYEWIVRDLWTATFYLGDHPASGEPIVGEFLLSTPGALAGTSPDAAGWRVCLNGNLFGGGEVSCLQAPNREMAAARLARQVLEVGRAYAFTVFYTFDPSTSFAAVDPRFTADTGAWGHIVDTWVSWVSYAQDLRAQATGADHSADLIGRRGLILDVVVDQIPEDLA